jgi:hypothetical protein
LTKSALSKEAIAESALFDEQMQRYSVDAKLANDLVDQQGKLLDQIHVTYINLAIKQRIHVLKADK